MAQASVWELSTRPEENLGSRKFASPHQGLAH